MVTCHVAAVTTTIRNVTLWTPDLFSLDFCVHIQEESRENRKRRRFVLRGPAADEIRSGALNDGI